MKPAPFAYHAPTTIDETVALLAELAGDDGRILAGGQSLVPTMAFRLARPAHLIDINSVGALDRLSVAGDALAIGACVRHSAFHRPPVEGPLGVLMASVVRHIAHYPIRVRGTFCGSLAHADPASEWCLVAATLGAEMVATSAAGTRAIAAADYFIGIMTTALAEDELLEEVRLPLLGADTRAGFYEFSRRAGDYALAMALATFRLEHGVMVASARRRRRGGTVSAPHRRGRAEARRPRPRGRGIPGGGGSRRRRDRSARGRPGGRRIPARPGARRHPSRPGARARMSVAAKGVATGWVGRSIRRLEDPALVAGSGRFTADLPAAHWVRFVRSQVAAGRIGTITRPDDAMVVTAAELATVKPICPMLHKFNYRPVSQPVLASGVVRFVGEPIAAAVAASKEEAEDIADRVVVEILGTPPVIDAPAALADGAPAVHDGVAGNVVVAAAMETPDFAAAQAVADRRIGVEMRSRRQSAMPLEPRAGHAAFDPASGRITLTCSTQMPHVMRTAIADLIGMPERDLRVVAPDVGGGFGQKMSLAPEYVVLVWLARKLASSVAWTEDRRENLIAGFHSRDQHIRLEGAFDRDARLIALSADVTANVGAYSCFPTTCAVEPLMAIAELPGPYDVKAYRCAARGVLTNTCPMSPYRGVSRPVITLAVERLMDRAAAEFGLEPTEVRRRNLIDKFPYTSATGLVFDEASYLETMEAGGRGDRSSGIPRTPASGAPAGKISRDRLLDILRAHRLRHPGLRGARHGDHARLGDRRAHAWTRPASSRRASAPVPHGQGLRTTLAQIIADEIGVAPERIAVVHGDTDRTPYGFGTFASRSLVIAGGASLMAARKVRAKLIRIAGQLMEASVDDIVLEDGAARIAGTDRALPIETLARAAYHQLQRLGGEIAPGISESATYDPPGTFSNACHVAIVEVDTETGQVRIEKFLVAEDAGRIINPMIVDGQIHGGVAQGIGNALMEEIVYDEAGDILHRVARRLPAAHRARDPADRAASSGDLQRGHRHPRQGRRRGRHDRGAGRGDQRDQRRHRAARRRDRGDAGDAAAHPRRACGPPRRNADERKSRAHAHRQRPRPSGPGRAAAHARRRDPRGLRADRNASRLRAWRVRRLHGAGRRRAGPLLPDVRRAGRRQADPHRGGPRRGTGVSSAAARLHGASRAAVRVLHARFPHAGGGRARARPRHRRRRPHRRARLQPVPLHRLPEHRQGGAGSCRGDADNGRGDGPQGTAAMTQGDRIRQERAAGSHLSPRAGRGRRKASGEGRCPTTRVSNSPREPLTPTLSPQRAGRGRSGAECAAGSHAITLRDEGGLMPSPRPSAAAPLVGRSVRRLEDPPLVAGAGTFAADVSFPHQLHMRVVRSAHAHASIRSIDAEGARALPGVHAVWTAEDVADIPPIDFRLTRIEGLEPYRQRILAAGRVRYVGEPVALVFAEDAYLAEDAADLVTIAVDELPPVLRADAEPSEFLGGRLTEPAVVRKSYGDVEAAFAAAHAVVALDLVIGRHSGVPLETRGAIARHDRGRDVLELYGAAKVPHWNRDQIAKMLGRAQNSVHLIEGHVGGGFGIRGELYPEDVLVCAAALRFGRPVKWIEDRREHLIAANHSRQQQHRVRAAVDADGRLLAIDDEFLHDQGAYMRTHAATVPDLTAAMLPGPYRVPAYRAVGRIRLTNKTPCGTYRAPGRFEGTFVRERLMDAIAEKTGIDRVEIRRRNLIGKSEMPYRRPLETLGTDIVLDSGDYAGLLDKTLKRIGWPALQAALGARRAAGEMVGAGVALFVEKSGLGPYETVRIAVDVGGGVEVVTGAASLGQGLETVIAQICGDALGVGMERIRVVHGRTDRIDHGMGAFASRVTVMTGEATRIAAAKVRATAIEVAAELLQAPEGVLDIRDGEVFRTDTGAAIALADVARALSPAAKTRGSRPPGLAAEGWFHTDHMNYPYGVHVAVVAVDRETGAARVEKYLVGFDIGKAVNPMLVEGQLVGGCAQGLGGALYEEFLYDARGEPLSVSFADYLMPTAREMPPVDVLMTEDAPSPLNPLGLKGAGEGGANPVGAAIAAAIDDAIGIPGAVTQLPVTPRRLKKLLTGAAIPASATG